jgi:acyl-CoA reductase-like NAD-dependent aldehyde dehydrogenase
MQHLADSDQTGVLHEPLMVEKSSAAAGILRVTAPFDEKLIAEVETCDSTHVDDALGTAHALFRNRDAWISLHERIGILERAAAQMALDHAALTQLRTAQLTSDSRTRRMKNSFEFSYHRNTEFFNRIGR